MNRIAKHLLAGIAFVLPLGACAPVVTERGYIADVTKQDAIVVGTDTATTVEAALGSPTNRSSYGERTWYYVSATEEQFSFYRPEHSSRRIFAVTFDENDIVARTELYGLEDGRIVAFNDEETPSRGRELTFLQQMFGNVGKAPVPTSESGDR